MLSLRAHAWIAGGVFAAIVVLSLVGNMLHNSGLIADGAGVQITARIVFFGLCLALVFSVVPLMVKLVLGAQQRIGNVDRPAVAGIIANDRRIVFVLWALIGLGLAIAIPAAIYGGAFD